MEVADFISKVKTNILPSTRAFRAQHMRAQTYAGQLGWGNIYKKVFLTSKMKSVHRITCILICNMYKSVRLTCMQHAHAARAISALVKFVSRDHICDPKV